MIKQKVLVVNILKRFMTEPELKNLFQEYEDNKLRKGRSREVNQKDLLILMDYKKGEFTMSELLRKHRVTRAQLNTSLRIAALSRVK